MLGGDECSGEKARVEYKLEEGERSFLNPDLWALKAWAVWISWRSLQAEGMASPEALSAGRGSGVAEDQRARVAAGVWGGEVAAVWGWGLGGESRRPITHDPVACSNSCSLSCGPQALLSPASARLPILLLFHFPLWLLCLRHTGLLPIPLRHWALLDSDPVHMPFPLPLLLLLPPPLLSSGVTLKGPPRHCRSLYSPYQKACGSVLCCYKASH